MNLQITSAKIYACKHLCSPCRGCGTKPDITWQGDGYGCACQCESFSQIPCFAHPDQAMVAWNRCIEAGDFSPRFQVMDRAEVQGKRSFIMDYLFKRENTLTKDMI